MSATDMTAPVTRGELREELALLRQDTHQQLHQQIAALEERLLKKTRSDLEIWGGALLERINESEQRLVKQLGTELARHVGAVREDMQRQFAAFHEAFADLPSRVSRLEAAVFPAPGAA